MEGIMKEFKILEFKNKKTSHEEIESILMEKSSEGWEVVSMTCDMSMDIRGVILVLIQRDK